MNKVYIPSKWALGKPPPKRILPPYVLDAKEDHAQLNPSCGCKHIDAQLCAAIRDSCDIEDVDQDDACECYCHWEEDEEEGEAW